MAEFTPFPNPRTSEDVPLVQIKGQRYVCTGCGTELPDGLFIHENVDDTGTVIGLRMEVGLPGEGRTVHECGEQPDG